MKQQNEIQYRKLRGLSGQGLRIWGLMFLIFGLVLNPKMSAILAREDTDFIFTSVGLIFGLLHYAAIPIFTFLLVEGFTHTSSLKNYAVRIGILAVVVELPYNYAMDGKLFGTFEFPNLATLQLNPVFGLLLALVVLYFFKRYAGTTMKLVALKGMLWIVAFVWVKMLGIEYGVPVILLVPLIYLLRNKKMVMIFAGCIAMTLCGFLDSSQSITKEVAGATETVMNATSVASYIASAPVAFIVLHFYNGEPGERNRYINYSAYPAILVAICLLAKFAF